MSLAKVIYIYLPTKRNKERLTHITFIINIDTANEKYNKKNNFSPKKWVEFEDIRWISPTL